MPTQSADKDSESVDDNTSSNEDPMQTTEGGSESIDMETTASADESGDSESASSNDDGFTTTDDDNSSDDTITTTTEMPTTSMMSVCVVPPNANSECECFAGQFVDACPQTRCQINIVNNEPFCVDDDSTANSFVADSADATTSTDAPIVTIQVDDKSGSGSSSSDDSSNDNVAFIGKQSEQKNDLSETAQSGTTMALIGLLSAAALLLCVSAIGGALYCRMKGKGYVDMTGMDIEMNGIMSV